MKKKKTKYIHVNQHKIRANKKHGTNDEVLTVKTGKYGRVIETESEVKCLSK